MLQRNFRTCDVRSDLCFQTAFDGFYRVRRNLGWRKEYFGLMEAVKVTGIDFPDALSEIFRRTGRIEASFASKLVATIAPSKPVIDKFVLNNFELELPHWGSPDRRARTVGVYRELCDAYGSFIESPTGIMVRERFDGRYPCSGVSELKKIDLVLWQIRS